MPAAAPTDATPTSPPPPPANGGVADEGDGAGDGAGDGGGARAGVDAALVARMREALQERGEAERLRRWLRGALDAAGWTAAVRRDCDAAVAAGAAGGVLGTAAAVRDGALRSVPSDVRERLVREIAGFVRAEMEEEEGF